MQWQGLYEPHLVLPPGMSFWIPNVAQRGGM
jgi:hypothetical protein